MPHHSPHTFTRASSLLLSLAAIFLALQIFPTTLHAQTVIPFYQFVPGLIPNGGLIADTNGTLYGTIQAEDDSPADGLYGEVYELTNSAGVWSENLLYEFQPFQVQHDGWNPVAGVIFGRNGSLLGTTYEGGSYGHCFTNGCGTVFELAPQADGSWKENNYRFRATENPADNLIMDAAGNLYGTTRGFKSTPGTVFEFSRAAGGGWTISTLYSFYPEKGNQGTNPVAPLILDGAGNLYGTAQTGGQYRNGTAFRLTPGSGGWTFASLYAFGNSAIEDGSQPTAGLVMDASGNLYGTTTQGGTNNYGTVFELSPTPKGHWKETILHEFAALDGEYPATSLIFDFAGNLYGVAPQGGQFSCGTIFELSPSAGSWNFNAVYSFSNSGDGCHPSGPLLDLNGNLYGTADSVAFEFIP